MRVLVVGGGVVGCASALALREKGMEVVRVDRGGLGQEASSAAAGILGAQIDAGPGTRNLEALVRARADYAGWVAELTDKTGIYTGYRVSGLLKLALVADEAAAAEGEVAWHRSQGARAEWVRGSTNVREIEPEATPRALGAAYFPDESQVDPRALLRALVRSLDLVGVIVRTGACVVRLVVERDRCVGVELDDGTLRADAVVLAAGAWSSLLGGVPAGLSRVRPVKGQMVLLEERPARAQVIVAGCGAYVVPRGDGRVLCGSTLEKVGFRRDVTAGGVSAILAGALACVPSLHEAEFAATWSGFRPYLGPAGSDEPLVGRSPLAGLFVATGHHRNGILLAQTAATAVARAVAAAS